MFDHMMKEEGVSEIFEKHQLEERDVTFIKELINGPTSTSEVWFSILREGGWGEGEFENRVFLFSSALCLIHLQMQQSRGAWLHPQARVWLLPVGLNEPAKHPKSSEISCF